MADKFDRMVRIQKIIADSGFCSRRNAEKLIEEGTVQRNGRPVKLGDKADPLCDIITVDGERINAEKSSPRYIKLYKPRGYVSTMSDEQGRKAVPELMKGVKERVYPIGRLDRNSEGLLLLTNDGAFANYVMHPSKRVAKVYRVTVEEKVSEEILDTLMSGIEIEPGKVTGRCSVVVLLEDPERTVLEFTIYEGMNRQIRRMCEAVGLTVKRLKRTSVGGVKLGMLRPGEYADLTPAELEMISSAVQLPRRKKGGRK